MREFRKVVAQEESPLSTEQNKGDKVCARAVTRGTHTGQPIMGIVATGKKFAMRGMTMVRILDDRITDSWVSNDVLALTNQLRG